MPGLNTLYLTQRNNIHTLYQVADASWHGGRESLCNILLEEGMLSYVVFDTSQRKFVRLSSWKTEEPATLLTDKEQLSSLAPDIHSCKLNMFFTGHKCTLVPAVLFEEKRKEEFFRLAFRLEPQESLLTNYLPQSGSYLISAVPTQPLRALELMYLQADFYHLAGAWLECLLLLQKNKSDSHVYIQVQQGAIWLAAFRDSSLQIFNTFLCQSAEDMLYYVLFVSEQLRFHPNRDTYYLSGHFSKGDKVHTLFGKYIKDLRIMKRPDFYRYSLPLGDIPEHFYFTAFSTPVCES